MGEADDIGLEAGQSHTTCRNSVAVVQGLRRASVLFYAPAATVEEHPFAGCMKRLWTSWMALAIPKKPGILHGER